MLFFLTTPLHAQTIDITPTAIPFGPVLVEESLIRTVEVSNTSAIYTATVTAEIYPDNSTFTVSGCDTTLITKTACTLSVTFTPPQLGVYTADLTVTAFFAGATVTDTATADITGTGVYEATPSALEGTYGSEIQYGGAPGGFGDKKGKIYIAGNKEKVDSWENAQVTMFFNKFKDMAVDTPYDVSIQWKPKGSKTTNTIDLPGAFTLRKPSLPLTNTYSGAPNTEFTITATDGKWFGTKKGKVYIGGEKCKVKAWTMNPTTGASSVTFVISKKLGAGTYALELENKIGRAVSAGFRVTGP
jgi:hypothetical protein